MIYDFLKWFGYDFTISISGLLVEFLNDSFWDISVEIDSEDVNRRIQIQDMHAPVH